MVPVCGKRLRSLGGGQKKRGECFPVYLQLYGNVTSGEWTHEYNINSYFHST